MFSGVRTFRTSWGGVVPRHMSAGECTWIEPVLQIWLTVLRLTEGACRHSLVFAPPGAVAVVCVHPPPQTWTLGTLDCERTRKYSE